MIFKDFCKKNQYREFLSAQENSDGSIEIKNNLVSVVNVLEDTFKNFRAGDSIVISGCDNVNNNKVVTIKSKGTNSLVFEESVFEAAEETGKIKISRSIPDFSCVCVHENRLWGCEGNTIYASKLGDPFNFNTYNMLSTDSYSIQSNSSGSFNACISYGTYCLFFKDNSCYKLYGNKPSNYQLTESFGGGIEKDSKKSIAMCGAKMFYHGSSGIYSFYGTIPSLISGKIENIKMKNTCGGCDGKRYYLAADTESGRKLFVYDIEKSLWSSAGETEAISFAFYGGKLHIVSAGGIYVLSDEADSGKEWYIELTPFDENYHRKKRYSRMWLSAELEKDAWITVETSTDGSIWHTAQTVHGSSKRHINIPLKLRCHELRIKISGRGKSRLKSIVREFSTS